MPDLAEHASLIQTLALVLAYVAVTLWEQRRPLLPYGRDDRGRIVSNFGLLVTNHALPYLLVPLIAAVSAWLASALSIGLLNRVDAPLAVALFVGFIALDLAGWLLHRAMHRQALLWRVHKVHHSDLQFDSSLGFRFHPGEVALLALTNAVVVVVLGLPLEAVLLTGVITTLHNFFGHANASPGARVEQQLRRLIITPDLHRVHHSADASDAMHNFGIVLSWWDRLAGTYRVPTGHGPSEFGLDELRDPQRLSLPRLLAMPFMRAPSLSAEAPLQDPAAVARPRR